MISDIKNPYPLNGTQSGSIDYWTYLADIRNISNMYPYGKSYPATATYSADDEYRYGFNGMEKEKSFDSDGDVADFGARFYDSEVVIFGSPDPKEWKYPGLSTYSTLGGNPIQNTDPDGKEFIPMNKFTEEKTLEYLEGEYDVKGLFYFEPITDENGISELQIDYDVYDEHYDSFSDEIKEEIDGFEDIIDSDRRLYAKFSKDRNLDFSFNKKISYKNAYGYYITENLFQGKGIVTPILDMEGMAVALGENKEFSLLAQAKLKNDAFIGMNINLAKTGTFNAVGGGQTLPCEICVFLHEVLDHGLDFVENGTMKKDPNEKQGEGTKYQDRSLKRRGSQKRVDHDDK